MTRIRLNTEYRNKIANRMRVHIEAEDTQEKEKYFQARENIKGEQDKAWDLAHDYCSYDITQKVMLRKQDTYKTSLKM